VRKSVIALYYVPSWVEEWLIGQEAIKQGKKNFCHALTLVLNWISRNGNLETLHIGISSMQVQILILVLIKSGLSIMSVFIASTF
jgi:hypothetical protein